MMDKPNFFGILFDAVDEVRFPRSRAAVDKEGSGLQQTPFLLAASAMR